MARLILLNGAPGVGKSTVASELARTRPLLLVLDVDTVRSLLGPADDITASRLAARRLALAMAGSQLRAGEDVVVPQYLGRPDFAAQLESLAAATDARFVEIVLTTTAEVGHERFDRRGDVPQLAGADESWAQMHARLGRFLAERPAAVIVDAHGDVATTVALVASVLDAGT